MWTFLSPVLAAVIAGVVSLLVTRATMRAASKSTERQLLQTQFRAQEYVAALNEVNLDGGVYFSQDLYVKFAELRRLLYEAVDRTDPGTWVLDVEPIRQAVYGRPGEPGLATHLKDDLGSYQSALLQVRERRK